MQEGEKYLNGFINGGILGDVKIMIFPNTDKKKPTSPDYNIVLKQGTELKKIGSLWLSEKKPQPIPQPPQAPHGRYPPKPDQRAFI